MYLHHSTRDNVTSNPSLYTDFVFQSLRGLESCDGLPSKVTISLDPLDQSAFEFVHLLSGGISENQLLRCDLSNKNLPANLFFFLLSALYQLKVAWLKLDGNNSWASLNSYTNCVIYYLGKHLLYLDEEEVTHQRLHLALKAQAESKIKITKIAWQECEAEALEAAREYLDRVEAEAIATAEAQEALETEAEARARKLEEEEDDEEDGEDDEEEDGDEEEDASGDEIDEDTAAANADAIGRGGNVNALPLTDSEAAVLAFTTGLSLHGVQQGPGAKKMRKKKKKTKSNKKKTKASDRIQDEATGFNLHVPGRGLGAGPLPGATVSASTISSHNSNVGIDTQLSNKIEILIHYLQVYGLVLLSSIKIDWPPAFERFSQWVRLFTLNLDSWFSFLPFQQNLLFWVVSFFPFMLLLLFWRISRLRGNLPTWVEEYVTRWDRTKRRVGAALAVFVGVGILASMLFIGAPVYAGASPNGSNYTSALCFLFIPTLFALVWYLAIRRFRRGWAEDTSVDKDVFRSEWLSKVNFWQWCQSTRTRSRTVFAKQSAAAAWRPAQMRAVRRSCSTPFCFLSLSAWC